MQAVRLPWPRWPWSGHWGLRQQKRLRSSPMAAFRGGGKASCRSPGGGIGRRGQAFNTTETPPSVTVLGIGPQATIPREPEDLVPGAGVDEIDHWPDCASSNVGGDFQPESVLWQMSVAVSGPVALEDLKALLLTASVAKADATRLLVSRLTGLVHDPVIVAVLVQVR